MIDRTPEEQFELFWILFLTMLILEIVKIFY